MKLIFCFTIAFVLTLCGASGEQQRILRRVIKSTPTATNLARIRLVTVRSPSAEKGAVAEISSKEAANFGQRSSNETTTNSQQQVTGNNKSKSSPPSLSKPTTTQATPTTTTPTINNPTTTTTTTLKPEQQEPKASDRQQQAGLRNAAEVELLSSAPSSWQAMTAVEAPAAMLIATGTRAAQSSSSAVSSGDLSQSSSTLHSSEESISSSSSSSSSEFLRSSSGSGVKGGYAQQSVGETFARLRQQHQQAGGVKQAQQYFYPPQQVKAPPSKQSPYQATKTNWYQLPSTTTTPKPAPIVQEQQYEQQQSEPYVEQQQYEAAPLGMAEPFAFDFKTDDNSGNGQYRKEESDKNGVVRGSYGYTDASGIYRHVEYVADQNGFRANIKSNEPGLIGETQPASIQLDGGARSVGGSQRLSAASSFDNNGNSGDSGEWIAASASNNQGSSSADSAVAPPDFESSHRSERLRSPRHFRN